MRDKYRYVDPDLEALYDAEAAARGEVRPPPRKKRHTANRNKEQSIPNSPDPSAPGDFPIKVDRPPMPPQQPQPYVPPPGGRLSSMTPSPILRPSTKARCVSV